MPSDIRCAGRRFLLERLFQFPADQRNAGRLPPVRHRTRRLLAQTVSRRPGMRRSSNTKRVPESRSRRARRLRARRSRRCCSAIFTRLFIRSKTSASGRKIRIFIRVASPLSAFTIMSRQFAPATRSASLADRPRETDAAGFRRGSRKPEESAESLCRYRSRTDAGQHQLSSKTMFP